MPIVKISHQSNTGHVTDAIELTVDSLLNSSGNVPDKIGRKVKGALHKAFKTHGQGRFIIDYADK